MAPRERYLMLMEVDIAPEKEQEWNDWYDNVHVPAILGCPGFIRASRYVSVLGTGPRYITAYEVENEAVVQTEEIKRARGWGPFAPFVISPNRTIYKEISHREARPAASEEQTGEERE